MSKKISYDEQQKNQTLGEFARRALDNLWVVKWEFHGAPEEYSGSCDYCEKKHIAWYCELLSYGLCVQCYTDLHNIYLDGELE